jgi:hypothetical protein
MNKGNLAARRALLAAGLLWGAGALVFSGAAQAVATLTLTPSVKGFAPTGTPGSTSTLTITAMLSGVTGASEVVTFHNVFLAYNRQMLTLDTFQWGVALQAGATPPGLQQVYDYDYSTDPDYLPGTVPYGALGTPASTPTFHPGDVPDTSFYFEGSVALWQEADDSASDIFNSRYLSDGEELLFTATFIVATDRIAYSTIALLDDRYFDSNPIPPGYDWKLGGATEPTMITVNNIPDIAVPVPAPLALLAAGLLGIGLGRRERR